MGRAPKDVTDAELAVLEVLWDRGAVSIRDATIIIYGRHSPSKHGTVQKLLERLEYKGFVVRQSDQPILRFAATTHRAELLSRRLRELADKLCDGSMTPILMQLIQAPDVTPADLKELHDFIRRSDPKAAKKSPKDRRK